MFEVNYFGLAEMTRTLLPVMRRQRAGHIVSLASLAGLSASPGFAHHWATKFAVEGYSEALAQEVAHLGIRVTLIDPGGFRSHFAGASLASASSRIADYADMGERIVAYKVSRQGTQPNYSKKFGLALRRLVDLSDPPLRLPLGDDAIERVQDKLDFGGQELDRWTELARSNWIDE
jgi:short-subunit dehydrogenase